METQEILEQPINPYMFRQPVADELQVVEPARNKEISETMVVLGNVSVDSPLSIYERVNQVPYTLKYFGIDKLDNLVDISDKTSKIENFVWNKIHQQDMLDSTDSYDEIMNDLIGVVGMPENTNPYTKINKLTDFIATMEGNQQERQDIITKEWQKIERKQRSVLRTQKNIQDEKKRFEKRQQEIKERSQIQRQELNETKKLKQNLESLTQQINQQKEVNKKKSIQLNQNLKIKEKQINQKNIKLQKNIELIKTRQQQIKDKEIKLKDLRLTLLKQLNI